MSVYIGIDVGTTNWKVAAFKENGDLKSEYKTPTRTHCFENGFSYYKADELWNTIAELLNRVVTDCQGETIRGVAVTSMSESVVPLDAQGKELFPIIAWFDASAVSEAAEIRSRFGEEKIFRICGLDPDPIFSLPKMLWVRNNYPDIYEKAVKWLQMSDYINFKLTGEYVTDYTMACRTLSYDVCGRCWSDELLSAFDVSKSVMPAVEKSSTRIGTVRREAAEQTGLPVGTQVYLGGHDHPCATIASGCMSGRKLMDSCGTAESLLLISDKGAVPLMKIMGQRTGLHLDPDRYMLWGGIKASGASADWGYQRFSTRSDWSVIAEQPDYTTVLAELSNIPAGSGGIFYIPHLRGSGAPNWNQKDAGAFIGLRSWHTNRHMLRAVFEGISFQARQIVEMHQYISEMKIDSICAAGGSTKNLLWQQIKADVLGIPVEISPVEDATVKGAALLAAIGDDVYGSMEEAASHAAEGSHVILPDSSNHEIYQELYNKWLTVNDAVCEISRSL